MLERAKHYARQLTLPIILGATFSSTGCNLIESYLDDQALEQENEALKRENEALRRANKELHEGASQRELASISWAKAKKDRKAAETAQKEAERKKEQASVDKESASKTHAEIQRILEDSKMVLESTVESLDHLIELRIAGHNSIEDERARIEGLLAKLSAIEDFEVVAQFVQQLETIEASEKWIGIQTMGLKKADPKTKEEKTWIEADVNKIKDLWSDLKQYEKNPKVAQSAMKAVNEMSVYNDSTVLILIEALEYNGEEGVITQDILLTKFLAAQALASQAALGLEKENIMLYQAKRQARLELKGQSKEIIEARMNELEAEYKEKGDAMSSILDYLVQTFSQILNSDLILEDNTPFRSYANSFSENYVQTFNQARDK